MTAAARPVAGSLHLCLAESCRHLDLDLHLESELVQTARVHVDPGERLVFASGAACNLSAEPARVCFVAHGSEMYAETIYQQDKFTMHPSVVSQDIYLRRLQLV